MEMTVDPELYSTTAFVFSVSTSLDNKFIASFPSVRSILFCDQKPTRHCFDVVGRMRRHHLRINSDPIVVERIQMPWKLNQRKRRSMIRIEVFPQRVRSRIDICGVIRRRHVFEESVRWNRWELFEVNESAWETDRNPPNPLIPMFGRKRSTVKQERKTCGPSALRKTIGLFTHRGGHRTRHANAS